MSRRASRPALRRADATDGVTSEASRTVGVRRESIRPPAMSRDLVLSSTPRLLQRVVHHELPLDAVPRVQVRDGLVVRRRERGVQVHEHALPPELRGEKLHHLGERIRRVHLELVLLQYGRVPGRFQQDDDLSGGGGGGPLRGRVVALARGHRDRGAAR